MSINVYRVRVGDKITNGTNVYTVHSISPAGSFGTRVSDGPHINAWIRPGGHGMTIDATQRDQWSPVEDGE